LRKQFHLQLARWWNFHPGLQARGATGVLKYQFAGYAPEVSMLAERYERYGYAFVPLVRAELNLHCSIDIMMLRPDIPGTLIEAGDLDNRVKTIIDALRIPTNQTELAGNDVPTADEIPFFCLLEEDKLISRIAVEGDLLLEPLASTPHPEHDTRLVIKVELRPYIFSQYNAVYA
jgi:hypothetical protein